jgi:hypothetical protein
MKDPCRRETQVAVMGISSFHRPATESALYRERPLWGQHHCGPLANRQVSEKPVGTVESEFADKDLAVTDEVCDGS